MGNRSQIVIKMNEPDCPIYLYSHWGGNPSKLLAKALKRGESRWYDPEYLARIIFCEMVRNDIDGCTSYGIGTSLHGDLDNPILILDCSNQTIRWQREETFGDKDTYIHSFSFKDFVRVYTTNNEI